MKNRFLILWVWILIPALLVCAGGIFGACGDDDDDDDAGTEDDDDIVDDDDDAVDDDATDDDAADDDDDTTDDDTTDDDDDDDNDDDSTPPVGSSVGDTIADFSLTDSTGGTSRLYDSKGKVILLDCAAMW